ncbi:MAG: exodeoxyribonuclease VII large subunit [Desulfomonilaceae bacterium]|nr:exodeoxyribonuclease VII large subunit [Desulfomonilaceae bacterium]
MELPERKVYTVSELTGRIRDLLEREFPSVWVQGEVSNFHAAPSGHTYFTLKDDSAQIRCVMFKIQSRFLKFKVEDGLDVIAWGRLSVYNLRGEYQLILDTMEPLGLGSLMLAFEQLKAKLAGEGLFDARTKKPIPAFPETVGLVTSPRGAAVRDMIRVIHRRYPGVHIVLSATSVQGDRAPDEIVAALERLCTSGDPDVIIIGRGGGSVEDLWAFNDERVVKATARCPIPIVSAVGHETDVTLTDFASDLRASTPSAAAEMVVPDRRELMDGLSHLVARLRNAMSGLLRKYTDAVTETLKRLYDPRRQIEEKRMRIDELTIRLGNAMVRRTATARRDTEALANRLRPEYVERTIIESKARCDDLTGRMVRSIHTVLRTSRDAAHNLAAQLEGLSPLAVMERGYSITMKKRDGTVVTDAALVETGEDLRIRLFRGELSCRVTAKDEE